MLDELDDRQRKVKLLRSRDAVSVCRYSTRLLSPRRAAMRATAGLVGATMPCPNAPGGRLSAVSSPGDGRDTG